MSTRGVKNLIFAAFSGRHANGQATEDHQPPGKSVRSRICVPLAKTGFNLRFTVARLTRIEPIGRLVEKLFFDGDEMIYLPKDDVAVKTLGKTITVDVDKSYGMTSTVLPSQILEHFIRRSKYHFIMDFCLCRDANRCKDYPIDYGCLLLGKGALKIDKKYGRLVTMEDALEHVRRCRGCGRCVETCPQEVIEFRIVERDFDEKSVKKIKTPVDIQLE